jgi:hypothetical protein
MRILLVDGNGDLLQTMRRAIWQSHRTWEVLLAQTGEDGGAPGRRPALGEPP